MMRLYHVVVVLKLDTYNIFMEAPYRLAVIIPEFCIHATSGF